MLNKITILLLVAFITTSVSACRKASETPPAKEAAAETPAKPEPPKPMPAQLPEVLARVNGEELKKTDFDLLVRNVELRQGPVPAEKRDEVLRNLLDQLVTHKLLQQESNSRNITVTEVEVEERLKSMRGQFPNQEAFQKALSVRNMSEDRLRSDTRTEIGIAKMLETETVALGNVTDQEAREFYDKNPDKFKQGEAVRASHILLLVDEKADDAVRKKKRAEIDKILKRARAGEDFAKLAKAHSQDGSAAQGGDLDFFMRGRMVPPFDQAAFALKPGEISDVVTTQFGYHIIKCTDRRESSVVPLETVSAQLKQFLTQQRQKTKVDSFISELKKKSKIEVLV